MRNEDGPGRTGSRQRVKCKRGGNRGLERNTGFVCNPKVISPKIWRSELGLDRRYCGKKSNSPDTESMGTNIPSFWRMEVMQAL